VNGERRNWKLAFLGLKNWLPVVDAFRTLVTCPPSAIRALFLPDSSTLRLVDLYGGFPEEPDLRRLGSGYVVIRSRRNCQSTGREISSYVLFEKALIPYSATANMNWSVISCLERP
jgi:hypothetical protein